MGCESISVPVNAEGIDATELRSILESWPASKPKPKVLYTVPCGGNPTGTTTTTERRREVLSLAREHNFFILEDDPYYYLYFGDAPRPPSYFSLELELPEVGRVIRFDSFSKILSSGIRIGFACGPEPIMTIVNLQTGQGNLQNSFTQAITVALLRSWGYDGFKAHILSLSQFYKAKRDVFERYMRQHLDGLAQWETPEAGLFFWFRLLLQSPGTQGDAEEDSEHLIRTKALDQGVLALPGTIFLPDGGKTAYVRAAFSLLDESDVEEAIKRLRAVVLAARGV